MFSRPSLLRICKDTLTRTTGARIQTPPNQRGTSSVVVCRSFGSSAGQSLYREEVAKKSGSESTAKPPTPLAKNLAKATIDEVLPSGKNNLNSEKPFTKTNTRQSSSNSPNPPQDPISQQQYLQDTGNKPPKEMTAEYSATRTPNSNPNP